MNRSRTDLLFNPDAFFLNLMKEKVSLKIPVLFITAGGIAAALYGFMISGVTGRLTASLMPNMGSIITIMAIAGAFIGTFVIWVIWAGIIHVISALFKGQGTFDRTLQCIAYGYPPQIAGTVISSGIALGYIPRIKIPVIPPGVSDPEIIQGAVKALMQDPAMRELTMVSSALSILFLAWSANIWIFGIKNARHIPTRLAAVSVGIPVICSVIYIIYSLMVV